jgi:hypothetical protein
MNFFEYLISQGVSRSDLLILLSSPILILLIAFSRQVIGLRGFGLFAPLFIIFGLLEIGFLSGMFILAFVTFAATFFRYILKHIKILYFPRLALILSLTIVSLLGAFIVAGVAGFPFNFKGPILAILAIAIFGERLAALQIEQDFKTSIILTAETLFISLIGYLLISWDFFQIFIWNNYLAVILISLLLTFLLGRWTGLRIMEYIRFWQIINK